MKRNFLMPFILAILVISCMTACKKDVSPVIPVQPIEVITMEEIAGTYHITAISESSSTNEETDIYNTNYAECKKDDVYTLNTDFTVNYSDAGTQCEPVGDRLGSWSFSAADNTITIEGTVYSISYHNSGILILSSEGNFGRDESSISTTFSKQ